MAKAKKKPTKRPPGRPRREREVARLTVYLPVAMKRWLAHQAVEEDRDMGKIVEAALEKYYRAGMRPGCDDVMVVKGGKK